MSLQFGAQQHHTKSWTPPHLCWIISEYKPWRMFRLRGLVVLAGSGKTTSGFLRWIFFFPLSNLPNCSFPCQSFKLPCFWSYLGGPNAPVQGMFRGGDGAKTQSWRFYRCPAPEQKNLCTIKNHNSSAKSHLNCKTTNSCSYNRSYHLKNIKKHCISSIPLFVWKCALFCATLANSSILKGLGAVSAVSRQVFRSPRIRKLRRACRSFRAVSCHMRGERAQGWWRDRASVFSIIVDYYSIHIYIFWRTPPSICLSIKSWIFPRPIYLSTSLSISLSTG